MENQDINTQAIDQPIKKVRVRRVGTITMGAALIITGIALCALVIVPFKDVLLIAKLSPLLLVALGIEVVIYTAKNNEVKLKYDFLSICMCLFIIFGAVSASLMPTLFQYFGPERERIEQNIEADIVSQFKTEKNQYPNLYTVSASTNIMGMRTFSSTDSINVLTPSDWLYSYAELNNITSKEQFAKAAIDVYKKLTSLSPARVQLTCASIAENNQPYYIIEFRGKYINEPTVDTIIKQLDTYVMNDDTGTYIDEDEYLLEKERIAQEQIDQDKYEKEQEALNTQSEITT